MKFFPIMGDAYKVVDFAPLDLSIQTSSYYNQSEINLHTLKEYVASVKHEAKAQLLYGGYLEQRAIYTSSHFTEESRDFHLGIDIWAAANTPLFAPCEMVLHSMACNDAELDYGYTLVYFIEKMNCYLLLGHLSKSSLVNKEIGMRTVQKSLIAYLGNPAENGGWEPHVHVQLIKDLENKKGDYPGVCTRSDIDFYQNNCPNPIRVIHPHL